MSTREQNMDTPARLSVLESGFERIERQIGSLSAVVERYVTEQAKQPKAHSFRDIAATVAVTIAVFSAMLSGLSNFNTLHGAVDKYRLEQLEKKIAPQVMFVKPVQ